jgi:undecaprenyl-diphosphatase
MTDINLVWFHLLNDMVGKNYILDNSMIFAAKYIVYILSFYLIYLWFVRKNYRQEALFAGYVAILGLGINSFIDLFYFHPRPFMISSGTFLISYASDNSFPSDHATIMFSISLMLLSFKDLKHSGMILFVLSFISGLARVYTGLHFPMDVAGSLLVALISICMLLLLKNYLIPINRLLIVNFEKYQEKLAKGKILSRN